MVDETSAAETAGAPAAAVVVAVVGAVAADDVAVDARKVAATFRLLNTPRRKVETARAILEVTIRVVTTPVVSLEAMTSAGHVALNPAIIAAKKVLALAVLPLPRIPAKSLLCFRASRSRNIAASPRLPLRFRPLNRKRRTVVTNPKLHAQHRLPQALAQRVFLAALPAGCPVGYWLSPVPKQSISAPQRQRTSRRRPLPNPRRPRRKQRVPIVP